jgi:hypothetical protein
VLGTPLLRIPHAQGRAIFSKNRIRPVARIGTPLVVRFLLAEHVAEAELRISVLGDKRIPERVIRVLWVEEGEIERERGGER